MTERKIAVTAVLCAGVMMMGGCSMLDQERMEAAEVIGDIRRKGRDDHRICKRYAGRILLQRYGASEHDRIRDQ